MDEKRPLTIPGKYGGTLSMIQPGEIRNPKGRQTAGACIKECINSIVEQDLSEAEIRRIARDKSLPIARRAAAERILRMIEAPDMADYQTLLIGELSLEELRKAGINTEAIKRIKHNKKEQTTEIELHDRAGEDFDRVMDRTEGKAKQVVDATVSGGDVPLAVKAAVVFQALKQKE